jgi:hypothetical protein
MEENDRKEMALWLIACGCSVIPIRPRDKKPLAEALPVNAEGKSEWKEFQNRIATPEEVDRWFEIEPDANIALVCGKISGVVAVDVDGEKGQEWFGANMPKPNWFQYTSTEHKFHAFYKHPGGDTHIPPKVRIVEEVDVRGDGSYVIFSPSIHATGVKYRVRGIEGFTGPKSLVPVPDIVFSRTDNGEVKVDRVIARSEDESLNAEKGERNEKLTRLCGEMYARRLTVEKVLVFAHGWNARHCSPPLPEREVETIAKSMAKTHGNRNQQAVNSGGVARWVSFAQGDFCITDIYRDLNITRQDDREKCQKDLRELVQRGEIEVCRGRSGWYRKREKSIDRINLDARESPQINMWLPFGLSKYVRIQPKNVIVVAGETNSGKTRMLFNLMHMNIGRHKFRYMTSEMTANEINDRIENLGGSKESWTESVEFIERGRDYHDAIVSDGINIIDFLEVHDNFSAVGIEIKKIFEALKSGIVFIALQKRTGELFGRGGEFTLEKARLGMSLFTHGRLPTGIIGSVKITKAKNFIPGKNPEGMEQFYSLTQGYIYDNYPIHGLWHRQGFGYLARKDRERIITSIEEHCKKVSDEHYTNQIAEGFYNVD